MAKENLLFDDAPLVGGEKTETSFTEFLDKEQGPERKTADPTDKQPKSFTDFLESGEANAATSALSSVNPDQASRARKTGMPVSAAMSDVDASEQLVQKQDSLETLNSSKALRKMAAGNPGFVAQAHDDYPNLAELENVVQAAGREHQPVPQGPAPTLRNTLRGLRIALEEGARQAGLGLVAQTRVITQDFTDAREEINLQAVVSKQTTLQKEFDRLEDINKDRNKLPEDLAKKYAESDYRRLAAHPEFETATMNAVFGGLESFIILAPATAASIILRTPLPVLTQAGAQTQAQAYIKYAARGATPTQAFAAATTEAGIEIATEMLPMSFLVRPLGKGNFGRLVGGFLAREVPGEQLATLGQDAVDTAVANPNKTWGEYVAERPDAAYATLIATLVQSGLITTGKYGIDRAMGNTSEVQDGEADVNVVRGLVEAAEKSKLLQRDPDQFAAFVQTVNEEAGGLQEVYIDADTLESTLQQEGIDPDQLPDSIKQQLDEGQEAGSIRIPLGEALKTLSTPLGKELAQHIRVTPDGHTALELETEGKELEQEAQTLLQSEQVTQTQLAAEAQQLNLIFTDQLTKAGSFTKDVNTQYAGLMTQFYTNMAQRLGTTPMQLLRQFGVTIRQGQTKKGVKLEKELTQQGFDVADIEELTLEGGAEAPAQAEELTEERREKLADQLVPSLRLADGTVVKGKKGNVHFDVFARELVKRRKANKDAIPEDIKAELKGGDNGFFDSESGEFLTRAQSGEKFGVTESGQLLAEGELFQEGKDTTRGKIKIPEDFGKEKAIITLLENADLSTFLHESAHFYFEVFGTLAGETEAPQGIKDDMQVLLDWLGIEDITAWDLLSLQEKRNEHEKFARGFEAWLFEGKAPAPGLQPLFTRFRAWLLNVYRSIKALNVEITDDVRGVFGRMLASEQMAETAFTGVEASQPLFTDAAAAGMTPREFANYVQLPREAMDEATRTLEKRSLRNMQWLENARNKRLQKMQGEHKRQRAKVRVEVTEEMTNAPIYRATRFLRTGEGLPKGTVSGLNRAALIEQFGDSPSASWKFLPLGTVVSAGAAKAEPTAGFLPDDVANQFGFKSGDELMRLLFGIAPINEAIDAATDHEMLVRFGDLVDPEQRRRAANEAVHNEARARFVAMELRALTRLQGAPSQPGTRTLAAAAKAVAERIVASKRISDLRPAQYSATANRLARAAKKALGAGDLLQAASLKRQQLVATHAAREAARALETIDKGRRALQRFNKEGTRKGLDIDFLDQIDVMLDRFDLSTRTKRDVARRQKLAEWIADQEAQGLEPEIDDKLRDEARRQNFSTMTVEEFNGLVDAVKNIAHLGRLKKRLLTDAKKREFDAAVNEAVTTIEANAVGTKPEQRATDTGWGVNLRRLGKAFAVQHRKFASFMREFDGFQDGGTLWELFVKPMNAAGDKEADLIDKSQRDIAKLFKPLRDGPGLLDKTHIPAIGRSLTLEERLGVALNTGNEVNLERLLSGENWTPAQLRAVMDTLTKEQLDFVQSVWDYLETFRPAMAEKERRVTGAEPKWVEAQPVETQHGTLRGGYYPIVYDPFRSSKAEADIVAEVQTQMQRGLYVRSSTRRGHLKARGQSTQRGLRFDITNTIPKHTSQIIQDLSWHEFLIDSNRLLRNKRIDSAIREHYGPEVLRELREHLTDIAVGHIPAQSGMGQAVNYLRKGTTTAFLGWRMTTSLLQPLGLTQSFVRLGAKHFFIGISRTLLRGPHRAESAGKFIQGKSAFMRNRASTMQREMEEILNKTLVGKRKLGVVSDVADFIRATSFWPIQKMQQVADFPTWMGGYYKAWEQDGMTEENAIALADQAVIDSQGGGQIKDLARIQRGSEFQKLWTNFYSFFSTTYNLMVEQGKAKKQSRIGMARLASDYFALLIAPPVISMIAFDVILKGQDFDDAEEFFKELMWEIFGYGMGTMIGLRDLAGALRGFGFKGPVGTRLFAEVADLRTQIAQGDLDVALVKKTLTTLGILLHLPAGQVATTLDGIMALKEGETESPGALIAGGPPAR